MVLCWAMLAAPVHAHEIRPTIADLDTPNGQVLIELRLNLEALLARIGPEHDDSDTSPNAKRYDALRSMPPTRLREELDSFTAELIAGIDLVDARGESLPLQLADAHIPPVGDVRLPRDSRVELSAHLSPISESVRWRWEAANGPIILRSGDDNAPDAYSAMLAPGETSATIPVVGPPPTSSAIETVQTYLWSGVVHIVPRGLDHILFVIGLFLLSPWFRPVFWQVSCFTLAHTLTLALATLGYISVPGTVIEPLIALSIAAIGLENLVANRLHRWRAVVVFGFGLLHGLGFASVLADVGLQSGQFLTALIAFNVGVELGQLSVILVCFVLLGWPFRQRSWYRRVVTIPGSLVITAAGLYWFVERLS